VCFAKTVPDTLFDFKRLGLVLQPHRSEGHQFFRVENPFCKAIKPKRRFRPVSALAMGNASQEVLQRCSNNEFRNPFILKSIRPGDQCCRQNDQFRHPTLGACSQRDSTSAFFHRNEGSDCVATQAYFHLQVRVDNFD